MVVREIAGVAEQAGEGMDRRVTATGSWKMLFLALIAAALVAGCAMTQKKVHAGTVAIANLQVALAIYYSDNGRYPSEKEGLAVLLQPATPGLSPYITGLPNDPWGRPYRYRLVDSNPVIESAGPDGVFGTADDVRD